MEELEHKLNSDLLFKMLFVQYPELLKNLISVVLNISTDDMFDFVIVNPEIPPNKVGDKFCILDIHMTVHNQRIDLEVQNFNHGDYPERSLFYWARDYSSALLEGGKYIDIPRVVIISILDFVQFDCEGYHSEYLPMEKNNHTLLTDKMSLHYFELPKIKGEIDKTNILELWLRLFNAKTEEDIKKILDLEVPIMKEAINAYRKVSVSEEYKELERLTSKTKHNEAAALYHAEQKGIKVGRETERAIWEKKMAEKDAEIARLSNKNQSD